MLAEVPWDATNNETLRYGVASWSKPGKPPRFSAKFAWRDTNGRVCRGGEVPVEATAAMFALAIRQGAIRVSDPASDDLATIRAWRRET